MKNSIILSIILSLVAMTSLAIPAKRVRRALTLADGTIIMATLTGDENGHWFVDDSGKALTEDSEGVARYLSQYELYSRMEAKAERMEARNMTRKARLSKTRRSNALTTTPAEELTQAFTGKKRGLVILVNFTDTKFIYTKDDFHALANEKGYSKNGAVGSVSDYFRDQSYGQFELEFDVVGPYDLSGKVSKYGTNKNSKEGDDENPGDLVTEAVKLADKDVNFADYDWNHDGEVDQVYIIYAGYSEEQGGPSSTLWSHEWDLESANYLGYGGSGQILLDNVWINTYACSSELSGFRGKVMSPIGTMCHEFSHCLGLPDFYDSTSKSFGMDSWSVMDYGSYNNDGRTPCGFTSYERRHAGWLTPVTLSSTTTVTGMKALTDAPEAYIIYNNANPNEFYLLENRQFTSWDAKGEGHGLLILHVDYDEEAWFNNTVNNDAYHQRVSIFHADNNSLTTTLAGDPYPGTSGNTSLTDTSSPSAKLFNANANGTKLMGKPITDISEASDGTISLEFMKSKSATSIESTEAAAESSSGKIYSITGQYMGTHLDQLPRGPYKVIRK